MYSSVLNRWFLPALPVIILSREKVALGIARSGFFLSCGASQWFVRLLALRTTSLALTRVLAAMVLSLNRQDSLSDSLMVYARTADLNREDCSGVVISARL